MSMADLCGAIRAEAQKMNKREDPATGFMPEQDRDPYELVKVLARLLEKTQLTVHQVHAAFGAPGDWGYDTSIGAALAEYYKNP